MWRRTGSLFINLGVRNTDPTTCGQVTFNPAIKSRPRLPGYTVSQTNPITTRSGAVIAPVTMTTSREICVGIDDFTTLTFTHETTGRTLNYHLYIPKGYESKRDGTTRLPLVVHYPSGDFNYVDWTGKYRGALFSHHDALYWSDDDSQAENPAFVVTVGGPADPNWGGAGYADSEMQQMYVKIVGKIAADYPVDPSRIYAVSLAGGTVPMWSTILANPTMFAAQITTAYDPYHAFKEVKAAHDKFGVLLATMPGWFFAGLTDPTGAGVLGVRHPLQGRAVARHRRHHEPGGANSRFRHRRRAMWNGLLRGGKAWQLADAQLARARARRASHMVTLFIPGTVLVNQHWSWDATYSNAVVRRWLFEQVNDAPYVPAK
jgi:predicted peptidase